LQNTALWISLYKSETTLPAPDQEKFGNERTKAKAQIYGKGCAANHQGHHSGLMPGMQGRDYGMYPGIAKTQRISELQKMQLIHSTLSYYQTAETSMQNSYVQTKKNKLYLLDFYRKKMFHIPDLIEYRIHIRFYVVNRNRISIPLTENPKIGITQKANSQ
jgi:hypothetical protein